MLTSYKKHFANLLTTHINQSLSNDQTSSNPISSSSDFIFSSSSLIPLIEHPPENIPGDIAFPCFTLAKAFKQSPQNIAKNICQKIQQNPDLRSSIFEKIESVGPYINVHINILALASKTLKKIHQQKEEYGKSKPNNKTVLIEYPGPNTNKPLHVGHVRNMLLGNCLANIYKANGYDVKKVDIINDRGVHICKSMLAYKLFGYDQQPDKKTDHFVGDRYVRYATEQQKEPTLKSLIQDMLLKREQGDPQTRQLWQKMNKWAIDGIYQTYKRFGTHIDKAYYESDHYLKGKDIVMEHLKDGIFEKQTNGKIVFKTKYSTDAPHVIIREDGTSIYITQDIALGKLRYDDFHMDQMIYIVGSEQEHHFKVLFEIFEKLHYPFASGSYHLSYGMVLLPDGKMKSREGNVVDADQLADDMHQKAYEQISQRYPDLTQEQKHTRAEEVAMAAIKFYILNHQANKSFTFFPDTSLTFEGETGPYIQYTHARCSSLLGKSTQADDISVSPDATYGTPEEKQLIIQLAQYPSIIKKGTRHNSPNHLTKYLFTLAQTYNTFYQKHHIASEEDQTIKLQRLSLVQATQTVLANGLSLLGITAPQQM